MYMLAREILGFVYGSCGWDGVCAGAWGGETGGLKGGEGHDGAGIIVFVAGGG